MDVGLLGLALQNNSSNCLVQIPHRELGNFEHGLESILTDSVNTPEPEVSFDEADTMFPSGFLYLVSTHSDNSRLQLAPSIKCLILWCQARAFFLLISDWPWCCGWCHFWPRACYSHTRAAVADTVTSPQFCCRSNCSFRNGWNTRIHDILDSAVSKHVGNRACIIQGVSWSLGPTVPFLHNVHDTVPPSETCLFCCINWSLAQAHQQTSLGLPSLQLLCGVPGPDPIMSKLVTLMLRLKVVRVAGSQLGCIH